jgi:3-carboxy-cis,cis-muconate cycloisomerase
MRPSSSPSEQRAVARGLFDDVLAHGPVWEATSDAAWLQAMLDAEAALTWALADVGLAPVPHAETIAAACHAEAFDVAALGRDATAGGNPVIPLVRALTRQVAPDAVASVHRGATSQDILDTAAMLVARNSLDSIIADLAAATTLLVDLARTHRAAPMAGRTLLQHAVPTTFGLVAVGWAAGIDAASRQLTSVRDDRLAAQLGGAAGTLDAFGGHGIDVAERFATRLGLQPATPWHTERTRVAELAGALGGAAGAIGKVATDIVLLAQTEVAEVREAGEGRGASSAMPHKGNPVAAISARASVLPAPALVATLLSAMHHEHQRAAGAWHAEWRPFTDLLRAVGSGAAWQRESLEALDVDPARMRHNLNLTEGLVFSERVAGALAPSLGGRQAQDVVAAACRSAVAQHRPLAEVLATDPAVAPVLDSQRLAELLDPDAAVASAAELVDRVLASVARG